VASLVSTRGLLSIDDSGTYRAVGAAASRPLPATPRRRCSPGSAYGQSTTENVQFAVELTRR
jgi:hypothetical protein